MQLHRLKFHSSMAYVQNFFIFQPISLGLNRSDYMFDCGQPSEDALKSGYSPKQCDIKQIEFNTMASSFGGLCTQLSQFHRWNHEILQSRNHEILQSRQTCLAPGLSDKMSSVILCVKCLTKALNFWWSTTALSDKMSNEWQKVFAKPEVRQVSRRKLYSLYPKPWINHISARPTLVVGQSWLWANLGLPTIRVCCCSVSVLTGIELCNW